MRALILRHDPGSVAGLLGEALAEREFELIVQNMGRSVFDGTFTDPFPDLTDFDLVVPMGAIWSINDESQVGTWIKRELDLLRAADADQIPVLGVCFGAQALAAAHGGHVFRAGTPEIGFGEVESLDPERLPPGPWMQWHYDVFTLPDGAELLAVTDTGPQAFALRSNLALQFHPEVTVQMIDDWTAMHPEGTEQAVAEVGADIDQIRADAAANRDRARHDIDTILDWWLRSVDL
ncbi:MAG: gamma-glutamyl-gamma-aminobutyrate hydrolase family protein [Acidimicrobiia bacterium]|nr:gamma-glutamyl-gamma-aminobutyrate hydrolase family protein [Acidimicrobiia bacterium]MDQ3391147.1 gamma-glutamyl-gamma-aminobutyrate hydrolase family protein [Actinomycetota bacterium]